MRITQDCMKESHGYLTRRNSLHQEVYVFVPTRLEFLPLCWSNHGSGCAYQFAIWASTRFHHGVNDIADTGDVAQVHLGHQHHASQPRGTGSGICPTFTYCLPVVAC